MLRQKLRLLLERYSQRFPVEAAATDQFLEFVGSHEALQGKTNTLRHITASAWVVSPDRRRVLLTHHAKLNIWVQLGGHTDEGEDWAASALREAREESGLLQVHLVSPELFDLDIHTIPAHGKTVAHRHFDLRFLVEADENESLVVSPESHDLAWVELSRLEDFTAEDSQLRMRRKTTSPAPCFCLHRN